MNEDEILCSHCEETTEDVRRAQFCGPDCYLCPECFIRAATPNECDDCVQEVCVA